MEINGKILDMSHQHPPAKRFTTKQDLQQTFTPSRKAGKTSHTQLFSPCKPSGQSAKEENTLEIWSSEYMMSISCVKHNLMIAADLFLFKKSPKDYINKLWSVIEDNNNLVEKEAITASAQDTVILQYNAEVFPRIFGWYRVSIQASQDVSMVQCCKLCVIL